MVRDTVPYTGGSPQGPGSYSMEDGVQLPGRRMTKREILSQAKTNDGRRKPIRQHRLTDSSLYEVRTLRYCLLRVLFGCFSHSVAETNEVSVPYAGVQPLV